MFWSEKGSGFGEPGGTPPPQIPRSIPPGAMIITMLSVYYLYWFLYAMKQNDFSLLLAIVLNIVMRKFLNNNPCCKGQHTLLKKY